MPVSQSAAVLRCKKSKEKILPTASDIICRENQLKHAALIRMEVKKIKTTYFSSRQNGKLNPMNIKSHMQSQN